MFNVRAFRFAEKHGLDYDKAANYAGVPGYTVSNITTHVFAAADGTFLQCAFQSMFADTVERKSFNKNTAFWPTMCKKAIIVMLPH